MREIKFRVWDGEEMFGNDRITSIVFDGTTWDALLDELVDLVPTGSCMPGATLMQYTGMRDTDGHEIYEDDVVEVCGVRYIVEYGEFVGDVGEVDTLRYFGWFFRSVPSRTQWLPNASAARVIGNIYESPELLETAKSEL